LLRKGTENRGPLRTIREPVRRIFNVAASYDFAFAGEQCSSNVKTGVGRVGQGRSGFGSVPQKLLDLRREFLFRHINRLAGELVRPAWEPSACWGRADWWGLPWEPQWKPRPASRERTAAGRRRCRAMLCTRDRATSGRRKPFAGR